MTKSLNAIGSEVDVEELAGFSLEELINIKVTSVSKREQSLNETASAIFVLSNEDIRRSGALSLPDALRQVPGMDVGAVNSSQWAVSSRGFNSIYANKLLVLIDGRAVYTPLFSGVYWDLQRPMLEDLDRVEVIRGAGGTIWGANAVNGVINVVSKSARETQGEMLYTGGGNVHQLMGGARYGGKIDADTYYRVFAAYELNDDYPLADGRSAQDDWGGWFGGFRVDRYLDADTQLTWQGDLTTSDLDEGRSDAYNVNTLGRWTRKWSDQNRLSIQAYYDRTYRNENQRSVNTFDTLDLSLDHTFNLSDVFNLIWGLGYRYSETRLENTASVFSTESSSGLSLFSSFVQSEYQVIPDALIVTVGVKVEHNDFTGVEVQPSLRVVFKPKDSYTLWAAVSRAVRTPALVEGDESYHVVSGTTVTAPDGNLFLPKIYGNNELKSGILVSYELGYRYHPDSEWSWDITTFYNDYSRVITARSVRGFIPGDPIGVALLSFDNLIDGVAYGAEGVLRGNLVEGWQIMLSYAYFEMNLNSNRATRFEEISESTPMHKFSLRSSHDLTAQLKMDIQLRYVGALVQPPAYLTGDIRLSYQLNEGVELIIVGQNLLDDQHPEQAPTALVTTAEMPRGVYGKLLWRF